MEKYEKNIISKSWEKLNKLKWNHIILIKWNKLKAKKFN